MADEAGGNDQSKSAPEPLSAAPAVPSGSAWKLPAGIEDHIESGKPDDGDECKLFRCVWLWKRGQLRARPFDFRKNGIAMTRRQGPTWPGMEVWLLWGDENKA
jgi:hypothetical protein